MVAFFLSLPETLDIGGSDELNLRRCNTVKIGRSLGVNDAYFDLRRRIRPGYISAPLVLFRRVTADHEGNANHDGSPSIVFISLAANQSSLSVSHDQS